MKCVTITEVEGPNPAFRPAAHRQAIRDGKAYDIPQSVTYPTGTVITGKGAFILCTLAEPKAVPGDKECHAAVLAYFTKPSMRQRLDMLENMKNPVIFDALPKGMKKYVTAMTEKWSGSTAAKIVRGEQAVPTIPEDSTEKRP